MTLEELKIRQLTNQYLLAPADKLTVMCDLCGVQAQFMTNALHSLKIRTNDYNEQTVADGLVKNWSVRGTVHVFAESDLPLFIRCNNGADYRKNEWQGYSYMKNQRPCWALTPERQKCLADIILAAVSERAYTRDELKELCRANGMTKIEEDCMFESWGGGIRELCVRGFMNYTVQEKKQYIASPEFSPIPEEEAKFEIARRYFIISTPKTKSSVRSVHLPQSVLNILGEYRETVSSEWVFPSPLDPTHPRSPTSCRSRLSDILERAECNHIPFHGLRHIFSTMALENGLDIKTLSAVLGHSSAETTISVSGNTHSKEQLNHYANQHNPNNSAYQANRDNRSNQCNPNNKEYDHSRGSGQKR